MDTKALRQKILDLAIRGKLVPQDPNDEPASVLLERIREQKKQMVKEGKLKAKDIKNDSIIFVDEDNLHYEKLADGTIKCIEDEIPFELPEGWVWIRLASILSLSSGKSIKVRQLTDTGEYPVYGGNGINGTYFDYNVEPNTIIIGRVGYYCGSVYKTTSKAWVTDNALIVTIKEPDFFEPDFLVEVLKYLNLGKTSVSTAQPVVSGKGILPLIVPVPPINEQINILQSYNQIIPILSILEKDKEEALSLISTIKSKILDLAIRGQLVPQNPDDEPASVLLERIRAEKEELIKQGRIKRDKKESIIFKGEDNSYYETIVKDTICIDEELPFDIPEGWGWSRLQNISSVLTDGTHKTPTYSDEGYAFLSSKNVTTGKIDWENVVYIPESLHVELYKRLAPMQGDILLAKNGTTGVAALVDKDAIFDIYVSLALIRLIGEKLHPQYILNVIGSSCVQEYFKKSLKGIGVPNLHLEHIRKTLIPIPPYVEQKQIVEFTNKMLHMIEKISDSLL